VNVLRGKAEAAATAEAPKAEEKTEEKAA
jgi:hypothetical protein